MVGLAALLAVATAASPGAPADLAGAGRPRDVRLLAPALTGGRFLSLAWPVPLRRGPDGGSATACPLEACLADPRPVGAAPRPALRPSRTELFLGLLERSELGPLASAAWLLRRVPIRVDWSPPTNDAGAVLLGARSLGKLMITMKLQLDPHWGPVLPGLEGR